MFVTLGFLHIWSFVSFVCQTSHLPSAPVHAGILDSERGLSDCSGQSVVWCQFLELSLAAPVAWIRSLWISSCPETQHLHFSGLDVELSELFIW